VPFGTETEQECYCTDEMKFQSGVSLIEQEFIFKSPTISKQNVWKWKHNQYFDNIFTL
jgi:hypothetical protein